MCCAILEIAILVGSENSIIILDWSADDDGRNVMIVVKNFQTILKNTWGTPYHCQDFFLSDRDHDEFNVVL